jgi:hypothetical protein
MGIAFFGWDGWFMMGWFMEVFSFGYVPAEWR